MKQIFPYFKNYKKECFLGPFFKLLEATFELLVPVLIGILVDKGLGTGVLSGGKYVYPDANKGLIFALCGVLILFGVVGFLFSIIAQYFAAKAATGVASDLRRSLFRKLQSLSYSDLDKLGTATMITRMTGDVDRFQSGVNLAIRLLLRSPFIVFGAMVVAFFIDVSSALTFAVAIPALAVVVFGIMCLTMPLHKKAQEGLDQVVNVARENISGVRVVRAFCHEEEEKRLFNERNGALTKKRAKADGVSALTGPLTYVLINLATVLLIYVGAIRVNLGNLSQGQVLALYNLMAQIVVELIKLANLIVTISKATACGNRIEKVLIKTSSLRFCEEERREEEGYITFDNVSLSYHESSSPALQDVDFSVGKGETVGIIGGTGSGKSSLVNLLPHFYDVTAGQVRIDGKNVASYPLEELREKIAVVPQKSVLFKGTIASNLAWGNTGATEEEMWDALSIAQASEIVKDKGGLDSPVEQGGRNFSGGQRQRLCIARALLKKPQILVLDDSFSALDYLTDKNLRKALSEMEEKLTVFIVSQRASAVQNADQIIVLDEGKIVGKGKQDELMQTCPVYREIYETQYETGGGSV